MENTIESLNLKIKSLCLDLIGHITRANGKVYFINASQLSEDITAQELMQSLKTVGMQVTGATTRILPEVEEIDFSIDETRCIELIKEIKSAQNEMGELCKAALKQN